MPKETSEALAIAWQDDVYVMIDAEEKSISKDANINEISKIVEAEVFVSEPPLSQESVPIVVNNDNEDGETLIIMMLRRSVGYTPPSSIYRTPLEIVNFNEINALRWKNRLISGLYIRISTAYDENEGLRRLKQFYEIFDSIVGYEDDGKYLILMGPLEEKDIDVEIDKVRKFGYIDATVIKK